MRSTIVVVMVVVIVMINSCEKRIVPNYNFEYPSFMYNDSLWKCVLEGEDIQKLFSHKELIDYLWSKYYDLNKDEKSTNLPYSPIGVYGQNQISVLHIYRLRSPYNTLIANVIDKNGDLVSGLTLRDFFAKESYIKLISLKEQLNNYKYPIDIVFIIDQTGSMTDNIQSLKNNIEIFLQRLEAANIDWKLGLIVYGDVITKKIELSKDISTFKNNLPNSLSGGAEVAEDAIYTSTSFNFRTNTQKIAILCTDEFVFQGYSEVEDCKMIQTLIRKGVRLFQVLPKKENNSEFLSLLTQGRTYNLSEKFEDILSNISEYLTNFYYIDYYEIPAEQKNQMDVDINKGNIDLQKHRINPFPLGYYKPFTRKNLDNYQRWLKMNPNLQSNPTFKEEYSRIIEDEKTKVHLQYILDGAADRISDYMYDLIKPEANNSTLLIEITGFTDSLLVSSLQNIDDYLILEGKEIGKNYSSNKELAYLRAYHTWKDLRELIMEKDPNDYFSKLLAQNRISVSYTYFFPDGINPKLEEDAKQLKIEYLRKVIIKYKKSN